MELLINTRSKVKINKLKFEKIINKKFWKVEKWPSVTSIPSFDLDLN